MVNYRRNFIPGAVYFFTVNLKNRKSNLLVEQVALLKYAMKTVKQKHPFKILAFVIMPEHLHMIWELPENDSDYSLRWKKIKASFSKSVSRSGVLLHKNRYNEYDLWQRRFWEHTLIDESDLENHINYIHFNPIKHGLVSDLNDWPNSSFHSYVQNRVIPKSWGSSEPRNIDGISYGEWGS